MKAELADKTQAQLPETPPANKIKKWLIPFIILLLVEGLVVLGVFSRTEMAIYDNWFRMRGPANPGDNIVVVAIDDSSIDRIGPLAWPRSVHAQLLEKTREAQLVAFDLTLDSAQNDKEDNLFAAAIENHGRVILGSKAGFETAENGDVIQEMQHPIDILMQGAAGVGFVNTPTDADHIVRRISLVDVNTYSIPFPSFDLAAAIAAEGLNPQDIKIHDNHLIIGSHRIPIDGLNQAMPAFWGPAGTFTTIHYADVLEEKIAPSFFKNKIVLVGSTTQEDHDTYPTPFTTTNMVVSGAPPTPGVEIHASAINSILTDNWYRPAGAGINLLVLIVLAFLTTLVVAGRGPWTGLLGVIGLLAVACGSSYLAWSQHMWLNLAAPIAVIVLTYVVETATDFVQAEMGRRKTRAMFSRYVSPDVVDQLMENPDETALGGKKQVITIMFCDIRGFTAYSENKDPQDVISRLNEYLTAMTEVIFRHGGTLDKYLGDGLMAFFGAPVYYEDHIKRAIDTAREIQTEVEKLNRIWAERGAVPLKVACGINTGPAVVGNVGSPKRMDYTLIGEDVNLASRVEALTKLFETLLLVSERSFEALPDGPVKESLYYVGEELVKGFTNPIKVYSLTGLDLHFQKSTDKGYK